MPSEQPGRRAHAGTAAPVAPTADDGIMKRKRSKGRIAGDIVLGFLMIALPAGMAVGGAYLFTHA